MKHEVTQLRVAGTTRVPFVKPMLARKFCEKLPERFFIQNKLDGVRAIATADGLWSRSGRRITSCPHIERELKEIFDANSDLILDGELYHHDLRSDLISIISAVNRQAACNRNHIPPIQFHIFDIPSLVTPFSHRTSTLDRITAAVRRPQSIVQVVETIAGSSRHELDCQLKTALSNGYEGVMIRTDTPYVHGRSDNLLKLKPFDDDEFEVVGFDEVRGNLSGFAQRAILRLSDGRTFKAALKCSRSFAGALLKVGCRSATVRYFGLTPNGIPRSPVAVAFHH